MYNLEKGEIKISKNILDYFGNKLMKEVRDKTILNIDMMIDDEIKGVTAQQIKQKVSIFNEEQMRALKWLIPKITDLGLYNLLVIIENNDIKVISNGLNGELYTKDRWIKRFSDEKSNDI